MSIKLSAYGVCTKEIIQKYSDRISGIFNSLIKKDAIGIEMTGWIEWVNKDHSILIKQVQEKKDIWKNLGVNTVVVIGTGGSYIGSRAGIEFCNSSFLKNTFKFLFVPYFSERYIKELLDYLNLKDVKFGVVVVSKSGTTLESSVGFRLIRELLFKKEGEGYEKYIIAVTDKKSGVLRSLADKRNISSFVIEDDIGGRYSTLTAVGLVPMILSGVDVNLVLDGAKQAYISNFQGDLTPNSAALYASIRHYLFTEQNLVSECICSYEPQLRFCMEKMKQLFAESEGKSDKGIMPILMDFTPDLHSVGQLLQDGYKSFFETILVVNKSKDSLILSKSLFEDDDQLDWLSGKTLKEINDCAFRGTLDAHFNLAGIPNIVLNLEDWNPKTFGYFYYWISLTAMFSSYLFEVNPFDQPGVLAYKQRMTDLLKRS